MSEAEVTIVDAWIEGDSLILLAPSFERLQVPLDKLARFIGANRSSTLAFEIDDDGRYLYWPHADVHMGWLQFVQLIDPVAVLKSQGRTKAFNRRYGAAIRATREAAGLKQGDIPDVTERHLRRVEQGQCAASKNVLSALAIAHDQPLDAYLKAVARHTA